MGTTTFSCTSVAPASQPKTCLPCDIPVFCRNSYYRGKLLTERDFNDEQRYGIDKMRLHQLWLHGWGVVCGLIVKPHPYCPDQRLVVTTGLAIDDCGRDIRLLRDDCVNLPQPVPGAAPAPPPVAASAKPAIPVHATEAKTEPKKDTPSFADTVAAAQQPHTAGHGIVVNAANRVGVPSFVGEPLRVAVETAGTAGLALQIVGSGIAREQVPAPGSMVPPGTEIVVRFTR